MINDLQNFDQIFEEPKDNFHITTLFIGGREDKLKKNQKEIYKNFKSGIKMPITIDFLVYIPGYILCGPCFDIGEVGCDNKFPHVTLYIGGGAKAVESNNVI